VIINPRFSKRFALMLMIMHCGALLLLLPLTLPLSMALALAVKLALGLLVLASAWYTTRRYLLLTNHPLDACVLHCEPKWHWIELKSGEIGKIASGSYSHPQLVVLRLTYLDHVRLKSKDNTNPVVKPLERDKKSSRFKQKFATQCAPFQKLRKVRFYGCFVIVLLMSFLGIERKSQSLIIFPDALDVETFRKLRVAIRYANDPPQDADNFIKSIER
jgi:hypothetical protein